MSWLSKYLGWFVLAFLVLFPLGVGPLFSDFYVSLMIRIFVFAIVLMGFDILVRCGLVSFGHAMFFGTGGYIAGVLLKYFSTSIWLMLAASLLVNAALGYALGFLFIRTRGIYFAFLTFAFAEFFYLFFNAWRVLGGADGLAGIPKPSLDILWDLGNQKVYYYFTLILVVLGYLVARHIFHSAFGRVLVAIRQNEDRTMFLGYDVHRCMRMAFLISGIFGGLGGSLLIAYQSFVSPAVYYWGLSGEILVMDLLGGMGTLIGPIIGSAFIISVGDVISSWVAKTWLMILGSLYVICIIFFPEGMMGIVTRFGRIGQRHAVTGNKEPQ